MTADSLRFQCASGTSAPGANSTQRFRPRPTKVSCAVRRRPAGSKAPDLHKIMCHLADAIALLRVSQRSLHHLEVAYEEEPFLRKGLAASDDVYTEIDMASIALHKQGQR